MPDTLINTTECRCNAKQPLLICFYCWWKGVRPADRLAAPDPSRPTVMPVPEALNIIPIDEKILRYKAAGILDCTCDERPSPADKLNCPRHKEFYGNARS
jgi:hypothetical protein